MGPKMPERNENRSDIMSDAEIYIVYRPLGIPVTRNPLSSSSYICYYLLPISHTTQVPERSLFYHPKIS